jgi:biopolymer transport protein ExbD
MAEIVSGKNKANKYRGATPIRIDLTPMVDLGFLLITFFILSTTLDVRKGINVFLPAPGEAAKQIEKNTEQILHIVAADSSFYCYPQNRLQDMEKIKTVNDLFATCNAHAKKVMTMQQNKSLSSSDSSSIIIEPTKSCNMQMLVHVFDAMAVSKIKNYQLEDANTAVEKQIAMLQ